MPDKPRHNSDDNAPVLIQKVWGPIEAEEALARLRSFGIPAMAPGTNAVSMNSVFLDGPATINIYTPKQFAQKAVEVLKMSFDNELDDPEKEPIE